MRVDVRTLWPHEALDFTPWLADNLDLLAAEIGLRLELVAREKPVGPYFLDILAKETRTQRLVAIENQLEWTNFGHLAQLLVYAAGCGTEWRYGLLQGSCMSSPKPFTDSTSGQQAMSASME